MEGRTHAKGEFEIGRDMPKSICGLESWVLIFANTSRKVSCLDCRRTMRKDT